MSAARSAGVPAARSRNAGTYLCNYIYWRALEAARTPAGPRIVAFVHVPPIRHKPQPVGRRHRRAYDLDELVRAGEAILVAMTALARKPCAATLVARPKQMDPICLDKSPHHSISEWADLPQHLGTKYWGQTTASKKPS